jgi:D-3-phosphoglycerate dehydrogenase
MPTVVVTDYTFPDLSVETDLLAGAGLEVRGYQAKTPSELADAVSQADYVITQFARLDADVVKHMQRAKIIVRYGIGVDNVALDAARARGIPVCNIPDYCIDEVADHTLAFMLAANRQVVAHGNAVKSGTWKLVTPLTSFRTLKDTTVGVVGFGRIGREVVKRLVAFKARVLVFDPVVGKADVEAAGATQVASLDELLFQSDIFTLHCPSNSKTFKLINADSLAKAKPGATFINVGRGDLCDSDALVESLRSGRLGMAMLDVFDPEPVPAGHPILGFDNVVMAPHIASASPAAVKRLRESAAQHVLRAHRGEPPTNVVNGVTSAKN